MTHGEVPTASVARVWVSPERARWLREERTVVEELADGAVVVELPYAGTSWLVREILRGAGDLVVLEPEDAREAIAKEITLTAATLIAPRGSRRRVTPRSADRRSESGADDAGGDQHLSVWVGPVPVIDPGPDDAGHLEAILAAAGERGGIGAILLTHGHGDHAEGAQSLAAAAEACRFRPRRTWQVFLSPDGEKHAAGLRAPSRPPATPPTTSASSPTDGVCFSGDLVLGEGSTFVPPDGGSLAAYMDSLRRVQSEPIELICPGHGPWITDPAAKLAEYVEHREMRERRLLAAIERGERSKRSAARRGLG